MPRTCLQRIARETLAIEQEQAHDVGALGYTARLLIQAAMPHKDPVQDVSCFEQSHGDFRSLLRQVTGILRLYPAANVSEGEHGLVLSPVAP